MKWLIHNLVFVVEIAVPMTWELDRNSLDKEKWASYEQCLKQLKSSFCRADFWKRIAVTMKDAYQKDDKGGKAILQLIVCLIRNICNIRDLKDLNLKSREVRMRPKELEFSICHLLLLY